MSQKQKKKHIRDWKTERFTETSRSCAGKPLAKTSCRLTSTSIQELTELLPTLKSEPRLSKYAIVDAGLLWNQHQMISTATHPSDPSGDMVPRMLLTILRTSGPKKQRF
ncbi:hypothetical protein N7508_010431 [Penicillium antarcticum]|uniref:uncharacterized protein n=1 Tax=Penicillium antarcticum TaxID=416450 RepID=UPI00239553D3|nr:uncharacterized protein N7508_010431 [Penicillium antarcticum]KAJ5295610.1 hypothetical protein N7508_010431 [Penicillium antarcticum]